MLRHTEYTRARLKHVTDRLREKIYRSKKPVDDISVTAATDRISFAQAERLNYRAVSLGEQFGPLFATFWFRGKARIPEAWAGERVDLMWVSHSEATLWIDGSTVQGLNTGTGLNYGPIDRPDATLTRQAVGGEEITFHIEMACNTAFGDLLDVRKYSHISPFVLDRCDIALFDSEAWGLYYDYLVLQELEANLAAEASTMEKAFAGKLLYELNRFANLYNGEDRSTWAPAHAVLKALYRHRNADYVHELFAAGHAHIDTAWLWPIAETRRKCERTFSTQLRYMEEYPEFVFVCSQAYQYDMIKEHNPALYSRIKNAVKSGQWVPVGGTWVEPDCNLPSGESLVRQFLYGQRFFEREFGSRCDEFWNPDVFGYNGQLPQLMRLSNINRFVTQKLSWNRFNKPQYHSFTWEGIDGSQILAHFPPVDTYNAIADVEELRKNARNFKDDDRSNTSLMLFGHGDGGGGPTREMLERLRRAGDLQGLPRTRMSSPQSFFEELERTFIDRPKVIGELYFEYHRGTYTSQAQTKRSMRKCEILLHDIELLSAVAMRTAEFLYPCEALEALWKRLLVNQFHDILPGSSIKQVYEDTASDLSLIAKAGENLSQQALLALRMDGSPFSEINYCPINTGSFFRQDVAYTPAGELVFITAPPLGLGHIVEPLPEQSVRLTLLQGRIVLENEFLRAELSENGDLVSLLEKKSGREALRGDGNKLRIYQDHPTQYDAWEIDPYHLETESECPPADSFAVLTDLPLRAEVQFSRKVGLASSVLQTVRLDCAARYLEFHCDVDWQESHCLLKVAFPVNVRSAEAVYEMQFGSVSRPTHYNTTYDLARFEVPAHKWVDLSELDFGVALLSESKYGFSTFENEMRMTLLRSPRSPDPTADIGAHSFAYAIMPHRAGWQSANVVGEAYRFNLPLLWRRAASSGDLKSWFSTDQENLVIETVKKAEDSNALIIRIYESHGKRGKACFNSGVPFERAAFCNLLEDDVGVAQWQGPQQLELPFTPFQIITLKLY